MNYHINVVNIKSNGCANTICHQIDAIDGVNQTVVNITNGAVIVNTNDDIRDEISTRLFEMGYPEVWNSRIKNTFTLRAKSLVNCVIGRLGIN